MTDPCLRADDAAQYVAGTLPADAIDGFEEHLLSCAECQRDVRVGAAARLGLLDGASARAPEGVAIVPAVPNRARARTLAMIGVAAAAVVVLSVQARRNAPLRAVSGYAPPAFVGGGVRSAGDSVAARVDAAMIAYAAGDFRLAAARLSEAAASDSSPGVAFYLGAARLAAGDPRGAIVAFRRAEGPEGNPYAEDAVIGAAKAFLRLGQPDSALAALRAPAAWRSPVVQALADSIREHRR